MMHGDLIDQKTCIFDVVILSSRVQSAKDLACRGTALRCAREILRRAEARLRMTTGSSPKSAVSNFSPYRRHYDHCG